MDINAALKEWVLHLNAPAGTLQKVKFPDAIPGSKGLKRTRTQGGLEYFFC